jgi:hypothetical protein
MARGVVVVVVVAFSNLEKMKFGRMLFFAAKEDAFWGDFYVYSFDNML